MNDLRARIQRRLKGVQFLAPIKMKICKLLRIETSRKDNHAENPSEVENNDSTTDNPPENYSEAADDVETQPSTPETGLEKQETKLELQAEGASYSECAPPPNPPKREVIFYKSTKELYKAVAKQYGITCKMSDHCRCWDCQGQYFYCEYDKNEGGDGGLGAGAPMFISEVIQGTACIIS